MGAKGLGFIVLLAALAGATSLAPVRAIAAGCPCPKSQMVELYGSVSMFPKQLPGPRAHQPAPKTRLPVSMTANPSTADVARASLKTPTLDRVANPLLWDTLFVQQ